MERDRLGSKVRVIALAAVAVATILGTIADEAPARAPETRAGWQVLEVDLHAHTRFADGFLSPFDLVLHARRHSLDVLAITDHNILFPALMGRWFSRQIGGPTILVGEELTTAAYHVHGVGLTERVDASLPLDAAIEAIHAQGGLVIAAHPVKKFWPALVPARGKLDGAEVMHPLVFGGRTNDNGWRWSEMRDYFLDARAASIPLTAVASSDYHFFSPLGVVRTLVFARSAAEADVMEALRAGRTVVYDLQGQAYGDAAMMQALTAEPYTPRPQDYGYRGTGPLDRGARTLGLAALAALLLFGPRRRAQPAEPPPSAS